LSAWTPKLVSSLRQQPELADVVSNQEDNGLAAYVTIDRDSAARLGISVGTVDNALYDAFGQRIVSTIFTQSNQYRVILEADPRSYRSVDSLASIYVPSANGGQVPLSAIVKVDVETRPLLINHLAWRRGVGHREDRIRPRDAEQHPHHFPGRRPGIPQQSRQ
jgi:multidrug efflux pump